jgi:hypothetical protein
MIRFILILTVFVVTLLSANKCCAQFTLEIDKTLITNFSTEEHSVIFDKDFLTVRLDNVNLNSYQSGGSWLLYPAGVIIISTGIIVGLYGIVLGALIVTYADVSSDKYFGYGFMAVGTVAGAGLIYLGSYVFKQGGPRQKKITLKQKQMRSIEKFENSY